jgi:hypothetical protein
MLYSGGLRMGEYWLLILSFQRILRSSDGGYALVTKDKRFLIEKLNSRTPLYL